MSRLLALCCACTLMLVGAASANQDFILRVEDPYGNLITDANVVVITQEGDHLKVDQTPEGTYVHYRVGEKFALEIEHDVHGSGYFEIVTSKEEIPKSPVFAGQIHKTVVLGEGPGGQIPDQDPPVNDLCEDAIPVAVPSVTPGTTTDATIDWPDMPDCGVIITSPGVWYSIIGTGNPIVADVCTATWDTKISVYCRGCDTPFCIGGNDDYCGWQSLFRWCSEPGVEYLILVHGYGGDSGPFDLTIIDEGEGCVPDIVCPAVPENDLCENAIPVTIPSLTEGSTSGATIDDAPDCGNAYITSPGVWYSVIGDGTTLTATTCTDLYDYDTKLSVYCGECGDLICIDGNDDECDDGASVFLSTVTWCSQNMAEYKILVHGYGGAEGDFNLDVSSDGMPCDFDIACIPVGACCFPEHDCVNGLTQYECEQAGGMYQGDETVCEGGFIGWNPFEDCANAFEDISGTGTELYLGDDDGEVVPLGFTFDYWGDAHTDIGVCSNGYLTFGDDLTDFSNDYIPDDYDPNDYIAPFWDDLSPNQGGTIHYQTLGTDPNRYFIAQWTEVPQFYAYDSNTFQAILYEGTNCIEFRYGVVTPEGYDGDYTIGIENQDGTDGFSIPGTEAAEGVCKSICPMYTDPIFCNFPPVALCQDVTVAADEDCQAEASIDNGSYDPDGDEFTTAQIPPGPYPLGMTEVVLVVTDSYGESATCTATVTVVDVTPPMVECSAELAPEDDDDDCDDDDDDLVDNGKSPATILRDDDDALLITYSASDNCGIVDVTAFIDIGCDQIAVTDGQLVEVECDDDDCEVEYDDGILEIEASYAELVVTATDVAGNVTECSQVLCAGGDDDDDDDDRTNNGKQPTTISGGDGVRKSIGITSIYPNPFGTMTTIGFVLDAPKHVTMQVYDVRGALVQTLESQSFSAGSHLVSWHGQNERGESVPAGIYFVQFVAGGHKEIGKLTLLKH